MIAIEKTPVKIDTHSVSLTIASRQRESWNHDPIETVDFAQPRRIEQLTAADLTIVV
jgi:hypothetical protein